MQFIRKIRQPSLRCALLGMAAFACLPVVRGADEAFPSTPVQNLRQALRVTIKDPVRNPGEAEYRKKSLSKWIDSLNSISDLRRALELQEWRDEDRDEKVSSIDLPVRDAVVAKFENRMREMLSSGDPINEQAAAELLADIGIGIRGGSKNKSGLANPFTKDLIALLGSPNTEVRVAATKALGKINPDPDTTLPALGKQMQSSNDADRIAASSALASLVQGATHITRGRNVTVIELPRDDLVKIAAGAVAQVSRSFDDPNRDVRRLAVDTVRNAAIAMSDPVLIPEPRSRQELPPAGRDWTADEKLEVDEYRKQVEEEQTRLKPLILVFKHLTVPVEAKQVAKFNAVVDDADPVVRFEARRALEEIGQGRLRLLRRVNSVPRKTTEPESSPEAQALLDSIRAVLPALDARLITDPDPRNRLATLDVFETFGPEGSQAAPAVLQALQDRDRFVRWAAARVLGKMGAKLPVPIDTASLALARLLSEEDLDLKLAAATALEHFGPNARAALPAILGAVNKGDAEIRTGAMRALLAIADPDNPGNMDAVAREAVPALIQALGDSDTRVRAVAAEALGRFGAHAFPAREALLDAARSDDVRVSRAASEALLNIGTGKKR